MDIQIITPKGFESQDTSPAHLQPSEQRLLLSASLGLLLRRLGNGIAVRAGDLVRLARYAEPDNEPGAC